MSLSVHFPQHTKTELVCGENLVELSRTSQAKTEDSSWMHSPVHTSPFGKLTRIAQKSSAKRIDWVLSGPSAVAIGQRPEAPAIHRRPKAEKSTPWSSVPRPLSGTGAHRAAGESSPRANPYARLHFDLPLPGAMNSSRAVSQSYSRDSYLCFCSQGLS